MFVWAGGCRAGGGEQQHAHHTGWVSSHCFFSEQTHTHTHITFPRNRAAVRSLSFWWYWPKTSTVSQCLCENWTYLNWSWDCFVWNNWRDWLQFVSYDMSVSGGGSRPALWRFSIETKRVEETERHLLRLHHCDRRGRTSTAAWIYYAMSQRWKDVEQTLRCQTRDSLSNRTLMTVCLT